MRPEPGSPDPEEAMATQAFDTARSEAFAAQLLGTLNAGALVLMTSIGHRTGLFDVMSRLEPSDSPRIADEAGLQERYVREWLGAMVTSGVVEYDPSEGAYRLPPEHAAVLTRGVRPNNLAATFQWIPLLGSVEDEIVTCFERGGGVPYSSYGRFHAVMAEESDQSVVAVLLEAILPAVPGAVEDLVRGIDVLDVGCGSGRALNRMAGAYPRSRFVGFDLSPEGVAAAKREAAERRLGNVRFEVRDVAELELEASFDLVTAFDAIHDQARPAEVLTAIARALRPDGTFLMQEIAGTSRVHEDARHPLGTFLYTVSCLHCMTVSLSAGGAGLGAMWGAERAQRMLEESGFPKIEIRSLPHDLLNRYYIARKGD
jgi:SAM-dependent methyltransferase